MARNLTATWKQGEVGKQIDFYLEDEDGAFDLSSWTVTLAIAKSVTATAVATGETVTKETQTGDDIGRCYHTLNATTAALATGVYKACELKLVNGSNVRYWPVHVNNDRTYFTCEIQAAIS